MRYKDGQLGIEFEVNKFSTFTILHIGNFEENISVYGHDAYMKGYEDGTFKPDQSVTRAEMAAMIARNLGYDAKQADVSPFSDVEASHWAFSEIEEAAQEHFFTMRDHGGEDIVK